MACAAVDAVSTKALGLDQKEHLKEEGHSSFGFRNIWLIMAGTCWAVGNVGGTVAREKQDLGTGIQCRGVWMRDKPLGVMNYDPGRKCGGEGKGRAGEEKPGKETEVWAQSWEKATNGSGDPEAKTQKNRKQNKTKRNIRTENSLVGTPGSNDFSTAN